MNKDIFVSIVDTCQSHAARLSWAMSRLSVLLPFNPEKLKNLSEVDLAVFDQFIVRYSKLQDAMGSNLLPAVLELTHEVGDLETFIDKLNRLEKIGALDSAEHWLKLREMRNQFAHDYPEDPEIQASLLNKAFDLAEDLLNVLERVIEFSKKYQ